MLFPWEDASEYEELRGRHFEDFQPEGPLQEGCIETVVRNEWRKRRVRDKRAFETAAALNRVENQVLWEDPPPLFDTKHEGTMHALRERRPRPPNSARDDYQQLLAFSSSLYREDSKSLADVKIRMLPAEFSAHLNEKVPFKKFESLSQWIFNLKKEVDTVLMLMVRDRAPKSNVHFELAAQFLTGDRLVEDLEIEERLDASTDRALKRFYNLKMARELHPPKQPKLLGNKPSMQLEGPDALTNKTDE